VRRDERRQRTDLAIIELQHSEELGNQWTGVIICLKEMLNMAQRPTILGAGLSPVSELFALLPAVLTYEEFAMCLVFLQPSALPTPSQQVHVIPSW